MSTLLQINDAGQAVMLIADAGGEEHPYLFRPLPPGISVAAYQLTRTDTESSYRVSLDAPGRWSCTCPAQEFRKRGQDDCKHIHHLRRFRLWLTAWKQLDQFPRLYEPATVDESRR